MITNICYAYIGFMAGILLCLTIAVISSEKKERKVSEKEQWWVFTFCCGEGHQHSGKHVRFFGTYGSARQKMFDKYGDDWCFQYAESEWQDWLSRKPDYITEEELNE